MDKYQFLTLIYVRTYNDSYNTSPSKIMEITPDSKWNAKEITHLAKAKVVDSGYAFDASKLRSILYCDVCNAPL